MSRTNVYILKLAPVNRAADLVLVAGLFFAFIYG